MLNKNNRSTMRIFALIIAALMVVGLLAACSGSADQASYSGGEAYDGYDGGSYYDENASGSTGSSSSASKTTTENVADSRKIIETVSYSIQTKTFDAFVTDMEAKVDELGG